MATRSSIAVRYGDKIKAVYAHWDGYLACNGRILISCYNDSVIASKLISMGDISSLGATIGEKHEFDQREGYVIVEGMEINRQCTFFNRDREELTTWKSFSTVDAWIDHYEGSWCEYFYLFENGEWTYCTRDDNTFKTVAEGLAKETV
jgi:hypothetical protein